MFDRFLKVSSSNGEQRWINLDRVTRVSLAVEAKDEPVLTFCFEGNERVKIHGSDEDTRALIRRISSSLDSVACAAGVRRAA